MLTVCHVSQTCDAVPAIVGAQPLAIAAHATQVIADISRRFFCHRLASLFCARIDFFALLFYAHTFDGFALLHEKHRPRTHRSQRNGYGDKRSHRASTFMANAVPPNTTAPTSSICH